MYLPIILGTARVGRQSEQVGRFVLERIRAMALDSEIIDARDFRIESTDNTGESAQAKNLAAKIKKASGLVIVSPEYNHGYPGELKMMLDLLYEEYLRKPVGFCGVSSGGMGGVRAVEQLRQVCIELHMVPIREAIYFSNVQDLFDGKGGIKDEAYFRRAEKFLNELIWYAKKYGEK